MKSPIHEVINNTLNSVNNSKVLTTKEYTRGKLNGSDVVLGTEMTESQGKYNYDIYKKFPLSEGNVQFNDTARWKIYGSNKIRDIHLQLTLNQIADTVAGTDTCCYMPGPMLIEYVNIYVQNIEVQRIFPTLEYHKYHLITDNDTKAEKQVFYHDQSRADRATVNSNGDTVVNIPIHTLIQDLDLYMDVIAGQNFYIEVKFKNPERVAESATATKHPDMSTVKINGYAMYVRLQEFNYSMKPMLVNRTTRYKRVLVPDHSRTPVGNGIDSIQRILHDIKPGNVSHFMFWITNTPMDYDDTANTVAAQNRASVNYDFDNAEEITTFQLKDKNSKEFKYNFQIDTDFYENYLMYDWYISKTHQTYPLSKRFRIFSFSDNPVEAHSGKDYSSFPMTGEEELYVKLSTATTSTKTLNIVTWSYALVKYDGSDGLIKVLK